MKLDMTYSTEKCSTAVFVGSDTVVVRSHELNQARVLHSSYSSQKYTNAEA